jgi:transmembrane sensor
MQRADWPFSVRAGGATIHTVGTKFSVRLREDDEADVLVIEGRIAIDEGSTAAVANVARPQGTTAFPLIVSAGESIAMNFTTLGTTLAVRAKLPPAVLKRRTAWTDGWIWFYQDSLPEAVAEFNRYHRQQMVLVDSDLATVKIGGRFRSIDLDSFIAALEHSFGVRALSSVVRGTGATSIYLTGRCRRASQQCNWPMVQ